MTDSPGRTSPVPQSVAGAQGCPPLEKPCEPVILPLPSLPCGRPAQGQRCGLRSLRHLFQSRKLFASCHELSVSNSKSKQHFLPAASKELAVGRLAPAWPGVHRVSGSRRGLQTWGGMARHGPGSRCPLPERASGKQVTHRFCSGCCGRPRAGRSQQPQACRTALREQGRAVGGPPAPFHPMVSHRELRMPRNLLDLRGPGSQQGKAVGSESASSHSTCLAGLVHGGSGGDGGRRGVSMKGLNS